VEPESEVAPVIRAIFRAAFGVIPLLALLAVIVFYSVEGGFSSMFDASAPTAGLGAELRDRGRIAVLGDVPSIEAEGAELVPAGHHPAIEAALRQSDEDVLVQALVEGRVAGLLVDPRGGPRGGGSVGARLARLEHVKGLAGIYLTPGAALYLRREPLEVSAEHGAVLARAARQILSGAHLPNVRAFPEPLRRSRSVEVLVMLRQHEYPKLWRSARGGSIARALLTACSVARDRWHEREAALGGPLDERLPSLSVEIYFLEEDGTLGDRSPALLERAFTPLHGVALQDGTAWHYLLPVATEERGQGSAVRAYRELFADAGLAQDSLERTDLRFYRLVARLAGTSPPSPPSPAGALFPPPLEGSPPGMGSTLDSLDSL
jgi:hypothetical protein